MNYFELEEAVFNHLQNKHNDDPNFTFSVRQKASKGAERNYFIGTEKSSYFAFTCWDIPVYFPGSSSDLTNFFFTVKGKCFLRFQYGNMIKSQKDPQSVADLAFGYELLNNLRNAGIQVPVPDEKPKALYYYVELDPKGYNNTEEVIMAFDQLYSLVAPVVDQSISIIKDRFPEWQAKRYSLERFNSIIEKMHLRKERFASGNLLSTDIEEETSDEIYSALVSLDTKHPLNTILYGPPGTGKTYHTVDTALSIIAPEFYVSNKNDRKALTEKFRSLLIDDWSKSKGQVAFVTFHQSMSYEDFIEGIKPLKPKAGEQLSYDVEDGTFKRLCKLARSNFESSQREFEVLPFEDAFEKLKEEWEENPSMTFPLTTKGYDFTIIGFTNTSIQFKKSNGSTSHTLSINSLKEQYYGKNFDYKQGVGIYYPSILNKLNSYSNKREKKIEPLNFVLIIDEINRGNVSQIFGELITLIEEDKRVGMEEALEILLPYSKESFGVPANVFIIGTMNTADRSVEALDTALRRRFSFKHVIPEPGLLSNYQMLINLWWKYRETYVDDKEWIEASKSFEELYGMIIKDELAYDKLRPEGDENVDKHVSNLSASDFQDSVEFTNGIEIDNLLVVINNRLEKLLSKDHQIGHAFFIKVFSIEDLYKVFYEKLIPQLQEYFYGDYGKIGLVLGSQFVRVEDHKKNIHFATFDYEDTELLLEKKVYSINDFTIDGQPDYISFYSAVKTIY